MIWTGHVVRVGEMRNAYKIFVLKSERNTPLETHRLRDDNVKNEIRTECLSN